ncbi:MAG: glycosyltransferase family 39 protein [Saprospiraceae bacterium]
MRIFRDSVFGLTALFVLGAALLIHHIWGHGGHFGFDDMHYARLAKQFADGVFRTAADHYTYRWGMVVPHGFVYALFGVGDHASAIVPIAATLLTLWCIWLLTDSLPAPARAWAMAFTAFSEWVFFYSDKLMPDVLVMACVAIAATVYALHRFGRGFAQPVWAALSFTGALFAGFLCKETVFLVAPVFACLLMVDVWNKRLTRFWLFAAGFGVLTTAVYLVYCAWAFGHPLSRFQAISANSYFNPCSYDQLPLENTLRRIGYELWTVFLSTGVLVGLVFIVPALMPRRDSLLTERTDEQRFLLFMGVGMLLVSNFMSTSPKAYVPLCLDIRHYLFAVPFVGAAAAVGAVEWLKGQTSLRAYWPVVVAIAMLYLSWRWYAEGLYVYAVLTAVLLFCTAFRQRMPQGYIWWILLLPLLVKPVLVMRNALQSNYSVQKDMVYRHLTANTPAKTLIISNPVECNIDEYLLEFDTSRVRFVSFKTLKPEAVAQSDTVVLILNGLTAWMSNMGWEDMPEWVQRPDSTRVLLEQRGGIEWYGLNKADLMRRLQ